MTPWNQERILSLARGFMESRVLLTAAHLNLFTLLDGAPLGAEELAARLGANCRALTILLDALAAMKLLVKSKDKYLCEPEVAALLSERSPGSVLPMALHANNLWQRWSNLTALVSPAEAAEKASQNWLQSFIGAMHVIGAPQAERLVERIRPASARKLLDVGGASGTYTLAFLRSSPQLKATLFDRPEVVEMARERLGQAGVLDRVNLIGGDFQTDPLPPGHDLAYVSAIIHQNSPKQNQTLFEKIFAALVLGGRVVIRDHVLSPDRTQPKAGALFAINMLVGTEGGNSYTFEEIRDGLAKAGFVRIHLLQEDAHMDGLVEAFKL